MISWSARAQCSDDSECKGSRICRDGSCVAGCKADTDCAGEDVCSEGVCGAPSTMQAPPEPAPAPVPSPAPPPPVVLPVVEAPPPPPPAPEPSWPPLEKHRPIWALVLGPILMAGGAATLIGGISVMSGVDDQFEEGALSGECDGDFVGVRDQFGNPVAVSTVRCEFNDDEWETGQGLAIAGAGFVGLGIAFTAFGAIAVNREAEPTAASVMPEVRLGPLAATLRWRL